MALEALPLPNQIEAANDASGEPLEMLEAGRFASTSSSDLRTLVDLPCRVLEIAYKSWRNLNHPEDRAELARDIAALANYGGGYIAFGFCEETLEPEDIDPFVTRCTPEQVSGIIDEYLEPPVRARVTTVRSARGNFHAVIQVGSHGAVPVCARRDGPVPGRFRLLERGACYIRKYGPGHKSQFISFPRPESGRAESAQDWAPLIRRCVRQDREALLAAIDATIEHRTCEPSLEQRVRIWHDAAHAAFSEFIPRSPAAEQLRQRHYLFSYGLESAGSRMVDRAQLPEILRRIVFEQQTSFPDTFHMFDPPYRRSVQPRFVVDPRSGDADTEFLQVSWLQDRMPRETADFWRVSPLGFASIARDYAEDRAADNRTLGRAPAKWLCPGLLAQELAELTCHARLLARFIGGVRQVHFRCEWWGLAGRELFDPQGSWVSRGPTGDDHRVSCGQVPIGRLVEAWPDVVAALMGPVMRAVVHDLNITADWVRQQAARWKQGGAG